jgi:opacity protein-like surface antigen
MKKIAILAVFALVAAGAFAQISMSAGGGLFLEGVTKGGVKWTEPDGNYYEGIIMRPFSVFLFFDATYAEFSINFSNPGLKGDFKPPSGGGTVVPLGTLKQFGFTLLGKYPIEWRSFVIFPLLGVGYNLVTSGKWTGGGNMNDPGDFSQFGILGGAGLDYNLRERLYLRAEVLYQLRFASKYQKDDADFIKKDPDASSVKTTLGRGMVFKAAVGYRF